MKNIFAWLFAAILPLTALAADTNEPTRIIVECEQMKGVNQNQFGPGPGWQVGRWGYDLYQNMVFGGPWASRLRAMMTDAGDNKAEATADIEVPADGTYKVWVKYECPPYFNYAFGVKLAPLSARGRPAFDKVYGLREAAKHYDFMDKPLAGDLYWSWGIDHDAAEGYETKLAKGKYRLTIYKTKNPEPRGARSIDAVLITTDLSPISAPRMNRYPLLDELRRANHVYFRFRNPAGAPAPITVAWNHWNHRYPDFYGPFYRELVKFYDDKGNLLEGGRNGDWTNAIAPGAASPWYDLGPTMNVESTSPYDAVAHVTGAKPADPSAPFSVDIALEPKEKAIVTELSTEPGEPVLSFLVQPDLNRAEGVATTKKNKDIYTELTAALNREPRLGPLPKKMRLFGGTGTPNYPPRAAYDLDSGMSFREALGLNTLPGNADPKSVAAMLAWAKQHGGIIERSLAFHHSQDPQQIIKWVKDGGLEQQFHYVSYGDEIGLPAIDVNDAAKVEAFRAFLREKGETPQSLGFAGWDQVKPLAALSGDVAVQIGVLPKEKQTDAASLSGLKQLYWYSLEFRTQQGIASFAEKTRAIKAALGNDVQTSANLGGMHPFYWMHQASFIESFKGNAMSLAWSEDYTYCMPEASRLVADFESAYLRKGASYHDTPMQFYCMPHWPGNTPEQLIQNAVLEWGQNVKDLDFFGLCPDIWSTENYVAYRGGLPMFQAVRTIAGMAGAVEDHLFPARTEPSRIAMLLSESSDVWETEGQGQGAVAPGSVPTNVSQEERKAIWYALRNAGYRVDHLTEKDCADGLLKNYSVLYVCGQNLERKAAAAVRDWVKTGGTVYATAGAARKDEFDAPLTDLDEVLGRGKQLAYDRYRGPLRARLELLFLKPLATLKLAEGTLPLFGSREQFETRPGAEVIAKDDAGHPEWISNSFGQGRAYYTGGLPGLAYTKAGLPVLPCGKGGSQSSPWMTESVAWDPIAAGVILTPVKSAKIEPDVVANHRGVVTNRLKSDKSIVITVVNLAQQADGNLKDVELQVRNVKPVKRAWSACHAKGLTVGSDKDGVVTIKLPTLAAADVVVLEQ